MREMEAFATAHAPSMLATLPAAWEKFGATPLKLWEACEKRVGGAAVPYRERAAEAEAALARTLMDAAGHAAEVTAWEAALPRAALNPGTWAQAVRGWPPAGEHPAGAAPAPELTTSATDAPGYLAPKHSGGALFVEVGAGGVPAAGGGTRLPVTPASASAAPLPTLAAATAALAALPPEAWAQLRYLRKAASLPSVVFGALCVLLGVAEPSWEAALGVVGDAALPARCVALAGVAWRAARAVSDAAPSPTTPLPPGALEGDLEPLVRAAALARKLLRKRPDARAEAAATRVTVRAAPATVLAAAAGEGDLFAMAPLPALVALLEWELALVHAVGEGRTWDDDALAPPAAIAV
jgi:hypothetical protein